MTLESNLTAAFQAVGADIKAVRASGPVAVDSAARRDAARWWPGVSICQRLVYRLLAACWDSERDPASAKQAGRAHHQRTHRILPERIHPLPRTPRGTPRPALARDELAVG